MQINDESSHNSESECDHDSESDSIQNRRKSNVSNRYAHSNDQESSDEFKSNDFKVLKSVSSMLNSSVNEDLPKNDIASRRPSGVVFSPDFSIQENKLSLTVNKKKQTKAQLSVIRNKFRKNSRIIPSPQNSLLVPGVDKIKRTSNFSNRRDSRRPTIKFQRHRYPQSI